MKGPVKRMKKLVKAAAIQLAPTSDRTETLKRASSLIELAVDKGAEIVCLPELFSVPWFAHRIGTEAFELAETAEGPTVTAMREVAERLGVAVVASVFETGGPTGGQKDGGKNAKDHFNTAFVIGEDGEIVGKYRKVHVPQIPLWEERSYFAPGDLGMPVFEVAGVKLGVLICWDVFFPEAFRSLALSGAELVFAPTASAFIHSASKWERAVQAAAHSSGIFVFRVNRVGEEVRQEFYGGSFCVGPDGEFVVRPTGPGEGVAVADIDPSFINAMRSEWAFMKDRRPELYGPLAEKKKD